MPQYLKDSHLQVGLVTPLNSLTIILEEASHHALGLGEVGEPEVSVVRMESPVVLPASFFILPAPVYPKVTEGTFQKVHLWSSEMIAVGICLGGGLVGLPLSLWVRTARGWG